METIKQLAPNQFYFFNNNKIVFQSYNTIVCIIDEIGTIHLTENQPQSKTTAKYLNQFLQMFTPVTNYKTIK
jgi:hypothetical protein